MHLNKEIWFSIMKHIRGQRRWSLITSTTDGLMMIALNGVPIGEFNVQRFSIKWIRDLGHLRCDDFSVAGQPHSTAEPTTENGVDPAGDCSKVQDVVRTYDHVYDETGNVYETPGTTFGNVFETANTRFGNVFQTANTKFGNVRREPNGDNEHGSGSVSDSAAVHEDSHGDIVEDGSGSMPESADIEQPPATQCNFKCSRTAMKNSGYSFHDELYGCNLGLTPENLGGTRYNSDGTPKCKRRRVENDEPDSEEFNGTPTELMRIEIRELTPYRFNNVEFLRESAILDDKKNVKADMYEAIVAFFPVKQLGDHSYITEALVGGRGGWEGCQKMVIITGLETGLKLNNHIHVYVITGFDLGRLYLDGLYL